MFINLIFTKSYSRPVEELSEYLWICLDIPIAIIRVKTLISVLVMIFLEESLKLYSYLFSIFRGLTGDFFLNSVHFHC